MTMLQWRWNDALSHHHYRVIAPLFRAIALFCTLKKMVTGLQMENSYITCIFAEFYVLACITRFSVNKHEYFGKCSRQPPFPPPSVFSPQSLSPLSLVYFRISLLIFFILWWAYWYTWKSHVLQKCKTILWCIKKSVYIFLGLYYFIDVFKWLKRSFEFL